MVDVEQFNEYFYAEDFYFNPDDHNDVWDN